MHGSLSLIMLGHCQAVCEGIHLIMLCVPVSAWLSPETPWSLPSLLRPQVPNMAGAGLQGGGIPGAGVQGAGQPGGFSPGQSQVTPQDHEKVSG